MLQDRNERILKAFERLASDGTRVVTWSLIKKRTELTDGAVTRGLNSLQKYGEVVAGEVTPKKKMYALKKFEGELKEKILSMKALKKKEAPFNHVRNIALGLKALIYKHRYHVGEEPLPKPEYAKFALQHLKAYPEINAELPPEICELYFPKEMQKLRKDIKTLGVYFRIKSVDNQLCKSLMKKFEEKNVPLKHEQVIHVIDTLTHYLLASRPSEKLEARVNEIVWIDPDKLEVGCGDRVLYPARRIEEANDIEERVKASILNLLAEEETRSHLQDINKSYKVLGSLEREFYNEVDMLIFKLLDRTEKLKGECDLCKRHS